MLGTTEFDCLGETSARSLATRGEFSWTELGKSTKRRGKLLCSGVGIDKSDKHRF